MKSTRSVFYRIGMVLGVTVGAVVTLAVSLAVVALKLAILALLAYGLYLVVT